MCAALNKRACPVPGERAQPNDEIRSRLPFVLVTKVRPPADYLVQSVSVKGDNTPKGRQRVYPRVLRLGWALLASCACLYGLHWLTSTPLAVRYSLVIDASPDLLAQVSSPASLASLASPVLADMPVPAMVASALDEVCPLAGPAKDGVQARIVPNMPTPTVPTSLLAPDFAYLPPSSAVRLPASYYRRLTP